MTHSDTCLGFTRACPSPRPRRVSLSSSFPTQLKPAPWTRSAPMPEWTSTWSASRGARRNPLIAIPTFITFQGILLYTWWSRDSNPDCGLVCRAECRCVCANEHERAECLNRGRYWNSALCQCMCSHPVYFPQCPTGYHYDAFNSCACISLAGNASALLEILIILLVSSTLVALFGVYQCRRYQVGFFQKREGREADDQVDTSRMIELRTIFRQISHQSPGFLRQLSSHHHEPIRQIIPERTTLAVPSEAMAKKSRSMEVMAPLISIKEGSSSQA